jgi:peptidoglycan/xylan/chitin deacetylase (PgdA/CDA1 family)
MKSVLSAGLLCALLVVCQTSSAAVTAGTASSACAGGTVYLTFDTGNMASAELIADILKRHRIRASFFLANEKTPAGNFALDDAWAGYWRERAAEGHAFGSHTYDHVYFKGVAADGRFIVRPQFGAQASQTLQWDARAVCAEIDRVGTRFRELTGQPLEPLWRAPGGKAPAAVMSAVKGCGWAHVDWAPAGFLGDELPSDRFPNASLLRQSLATIRDGDILMAHLGIWSRVQAYAPTLDPLIAGLKAKGMCFATLREHPSFRR